MSILIGNNVKAQALGISCSFTLNPFTISTMFVLNPNQCFNTHAKKINRHSLGQS